MKNTPLRCAVKGCTAKFVYQARCQKHFFEWMRKKKMEKGREFKCVK